MYATAPASLAPEPVVTSADVLAHEGLVVHLVSRYQRVARRRGLEFQDLVNAGLVLVWRALRRRAVVPCKLSTYLGNQINWGMIALLRQAKEWRSLPVDTEDGWSKEPAARPEPDQVEAADEAARVRDLLRVLPRRHRLILELRFGLGDGEPMSLEGVGARLGLSTERVRQLEGKALARLRAAAFAKGLG